MKFILSLIVVIVICCLNLVYSALPENVLVDSVESYGTIEQSTSDPLIYSFNLTKQTATNITVTPCFGTFEILVGLNKVVTDISQSPTYFGEWDPTVKALGTNLKELPVGTIIYIAVKPIEDFTFNSKPVAASFSILISTSEDEFVVPYTPIPAREGSIDVKLINGGKSGTISFFKTGDSADSYSIYTFYGEKPKGSFPFSACGIKFYATEKTDQKIEDNGANEASATFTGLNPKEPTGLTVVVTRKPKNYASAYNYVIFNAPSSSVNLQSSIFNLLPALFICTIITFILF